MFRLYKFLAAVAVTIGLALTASAAPTNLVVNGDFSQDFINETNDIYYKAPKYWTISPNPAMTSSSYYYVFDINFYALDTIRYYTSINCPEHCVLNSPTSLSQKINNLITGHKYQLNYMLDLREVDTTHDIYGNYDPYYRDSNSFHVEFDGQSTQPITVPAPPVNFPDASVRFKSYQNVFTYAGNTGSAILSFVIKLTEPFYSCTPCNFPASGVYEQLANVSLTDVSPAAPTLSVQKALSGNRGANTDQFTVQILDGVKVVNSTTKSTTTGNGSTVDVGTGTTGLTTLVAGTSYKITEVGSGNTNLGGYSSTLACTNSTGSTVPTALNTAFTLSNTDTVSCTITNKAKPATLVVRQQVSGTLPVNIVAPYTFPYTGTNGWGTESVTNPTKESFVSSPAKTLSAFNTATQLTITLPENRWRTDTFSCADTTAAASGNPVGDLVAAPGQTSVTIPAANVRPGATLRCTLVLRHSTP
jgi:hypothetical protein